MLVMADAAVVSLVSFTLGWSGRMSHSFQELERLKRSYIEGLKQAREIPIPSNFKSEEDRA